MNATAWIDGASRGNPGEAGFGALIETGDGQVEIIGFLGRATNNVAEYAGLLAVLTWAERNGVAHLLLHSDSQLLVRQFNGMYRVKAPHLKPIHREAQSLRKRIPRVEARHVPRGENNHADELANRAIDERAALPSWLPIDHLLPKSD